MVKFVYLILPAFVKYKIMPEELPVKNFASTNHITLELKYKNDQGILQHELQHVRQWYRSLIPFCYKSYKNDREYRLKCEAEAYLVQTKYPDRNGHYLTLEEAAVKLTWDRYNLNLTTEQALAILQDMS